MTRYTLACNQDCHWYVIPASRVHDFELWWEEDEDREPPDWADRVEGDPGLVTFENYEIG